jgi:hypothetical protein
MRIFLSYTSEDRQSAEEVELRLRPSRHHVFWDRDSLVSGKEFDDKIRKEIQRAYLFMFLISPRSVRPNHYCLSELKFAREKWKHPAGHVLPVMVEETPLDSVPKYLQAVGILQPEGNLAAEVVARVAELARERRTGLLRRAFGFCAGLAALALSVIAVVWLAIPGVFDFRTSLSRSTELAWQNALSEWQKRLLDSQQTSQTPNARGFRTWIGEAAHRTDALTSAQCIVALIGASAPQNHRLTSDETASIRDAFRYIETIRLKAAEPGGRIESYLRLQTPEPANVQTDDEGWGLVPYSRPTVTEIASWIVLAKIFALQTGTIWIESEQIQSVQNSVLRDLNYIVSRQADDGGWSPIFYVTRDNTRTYTTALAVWSLIEALRTQGLAAEAMDAPIRERIKHGIRWLLKYRQRNGWMPNPESSSTPEDTVYPGLTAQVLYILSRAELVPHMPSDDRYADAKRDFLADSSILALHPGSNVAIANPDTYFDSPNGRRTGPLEATTFSWFAWATVVYKVLAEDSSLSPHEQSIARKRLYTLLNEYKEVFHHVGASQCETWEVAENLFCESEVFHH